MTESGRAVTTTRRSVPQPSRTGPPPWSFIFPVVVGIVLRWWNLGGPGLSADEMFTGVHSVESLPGGIIARVVEDDIHPPLDYLIRNPLALSHDNFWLRAPSAAFATASLLLVWWWARGKGWLGFWFVSLTAISSFQILYARTARPYSLLLACGTIVAFAADRWRTEKATKWAVVALLSATVALFADSTGGLIVLGGILVPGRSREREAWIWRFAMVGAGVVFAAAWGAVTLKQYKANGVSYLPLSNPSYAIRETGRLMATFFPDNSFVLVPLFILGALALLSLDRKLCWISTSLSIVPFGAAVVAGVFVHFFVARSLSAVAWAAPLLLAAFLVWCQRRSIPIAIGAVALLAILLVPSIPHALAFDEEAQAAAEYAQSITSPGDGLIMRPHFLSHIVEWSFRTPRHALEAPWWNNTDDPSTDCSSPTIRSYTTVQPGAPFTGRVIVIDACGGVFAPNGSRPCPGIETRAFGMYRVSCLEVQRPDPGN